MGKRVLFVSTHGIGDLAMQFSGMGESFDSFEMTFIVTGEIEAKFVNFYYPSATVFVMKRNRGLFRMAALWLEINRQRYDYVFAQYNVNLFKFFLFTLFLANKYVISNKRVANIFATKLYQGKLHKIDAMAQWRNVIHNFSTLSVGSNESVLSKQLPSEKEKRVVATSLKVLLAISSFEEESYKRWPLEYYAILCSLLAKEYDVSFELYGSEAEFEYGEKLVARLGDIPIENSCGKLDFEDVLTKIPEFDFAICNCNAFSHISSLSKVPTVAIYGPTDPFITGLYDRFNNLIITTDKACSPCYGRGGPCLAPTCMDGILPDMVAEKVKAIFRGSFKL